MASKRAAAIAEFMKCVFHYVQLAAAPPQLGQKPRKVPTMLFVAHRPHKRSWVKREKRSLASWKVCLRPLWFCTPEFSWCSRSWLFVFKPQFDNESACFCLASRIHRGMAEHQFCAYFQNCCGWSNLGKSSNKLLAAVKLPSDTSRWEPITLTLLGYKNSFC